MCVCLCNLAPKTNDRSRSNSVSRIFLLISRTYFFFFSFPATLKIKGSLLKEQANELSDKHGILQTRSIVSVAMLFNQQEKPLINKVLLSII